MFFPPADHLRARKWDEVLPQAVRLPHMTPVLQLGQSSTITQIKKPTLRLNHWFEEKEGNFDYFFCKKTFSQHNWQRNHPVSHSKSKNFAVVSFRFIFRQRILLQINSLTLEQNGLNLPNLISGCFCSIMSWQTVESGGDVVQPI